MASKINATNIDITYPIAGQDNDTQGFRTNFTNIRNNLNTAGLEISALQANVVTLQSTTSNLVHSNATPTSATDIGTAGQIAYDASHIYVCIATNTWVRANLTTF